jgi:bacteriorhodopsin
MEILVKKSFHVTLILLTASMLLTMLHAVRDETEPLKARALTLSSVVCLIASLHYGLMMMTPDHATAYRYLDWVITTPILLYELLLSTSGGHVPLRVLVNNTLMLVAGFFGELNKVPRLVSASLGFVPFVTMAQDMTRIMGPRFSSISTVFFSVWALYGIVHLFPNDNVRDFTYNILDIVSKAGFGAYIWSTGS